MDYRQRTLAEAATESSGFRHMMDSVTQIVARVMTAATILFAGYTAVDWAQGQNTVLVRGIGTIVLLLSLAGWVHARRRYQVTVAALSGLVFSTTISVATTIVTAQSGTSFQIAMAYGLVIAVLNVLVWRRAWAVLIGCAGAIGPPFVLMLRQDAPSGSVADFTGLAVVTVVMAIVVLRVQMQLLNQLLHTQAELLDRASVDGLTGLPNRTTWLERVAAWQGDHPGKAYEVLFLDLDHFKEVNDRFGHDAGDRILSAFARLVAALVPDGGIVARFGGDEFVVFIPGGAMETGRFQDALEREMARSELPGLDVGVSIGRATGAPGSGGEDVLWQADQALLESKRRVQRDPAPV